MAQNFHARLVIYDLPKMNPRGAKNIAAWLKRIAKELETEKDLKIFSKRYIMRYMK